MRRRRREPRRYRRRSTLLPTRHRGCGPGVARIAIGGHRADRAARHASRQCRPSMGSCRCRSPRSAHRQRRIGRPIAAGSKASSWAETARPPAPPHGLKSLSPMQRITERPAASAASALALTSASVSPCASRRSRWPTMVSPRRRQQHGSRNAAGMGALVGGVEILSADRKPGAARTARSISVAGRHRATSAPSHRRPSDNGRDLAQVGREPRAFSNCRPPACAAP